jgi:DNA-binding NtrC family response regulator
MKGQKDQVSNINKYILAVDDDPDITGLVKEALSRHGLKVSAFTDASMALDHFKANHKNCSLVLSDIRMPGMNRYELVMQIKKINTKVKVILMSAFEIQEKGIYIVLSDIKVDAFLQKPFSLQKLNDVIKSVNAKASMI